MMANKASGRGRTLFVSAAFADMVVDLARASGKTVRTFCDADVTPLLAPRHRKVLAAKLRKAKAGG